MKSILCFGDSNTHGSEPMPDLVTSGRYPKPLRWTSVMANALGKDFDVIPEGHPGRTAAFDDPVEGAHKNGLRVLPALLQSHKPLDLVIVYLGTNDLKARFNLPAIDIALGLARLCDVNRAYGVGPVGALPRLLFLSPVPILETGCLAEMFTGGAPKSRALAGYIEGIAAQNEAAFLDLARFATVDPLDGVHLSVESQSAIGEAIATKVLEIFSDV